MLAFRRLPLTTKNLTNLSRVLGQRLTKLTIVISCRRMLKQFRQHPLRLRLVPCRGTVPRLVLTPLGAINGG